MTAASHRVSVDVLGVDVGALGDELARVVEVAVQHRRHQVLAEHANRVIV